MALYVYIPVSINASMFPLCLFLVFNPILLKTQEKDLTEEQSRKHKCPFFWTSVSDDRHAQLDQLTFAPFS